MNGTIAQALALVCHGNAWLRDIATLSTFADNSTRQFCDRIEFVELPGAVFTGKPKEKVVAATPESWFMHLKGNGTHGLRLRYGVPDNQSINPWMTAGFVGGGGQWTVTTFASQRSSTWAARWNVWNQRAPDQRIWRVTYIRIGEQHDDAPIRSSPPGVVAENLSKALREIASFARQHDCGGFTVAFEAALRILESVDAPDVYHKDLAPPGCLPERATTLLAACQKAWVFGGMGSWNDMAFDGQVHEDYLRVSGQLFSTVVAGIVAATNESCPGG